MREKVVQAVCLPDAVKRKLLPDEEVLWIGQPPSGFMLRPMDAFLEPVAILWAAFAFYFMVGCFVTSTEPGLASLIFDLFGVGFCCFGIYIAVGRFFFDRARRRQTWYAVTSSRALIVQAWPRARVRTFELDGLSDIRLDEGFDDIGTIRLPGGNDLLFLMMGGVESWPWAASVAPPTFEKIHNARQVYDLIRHIRYEHRAPSAVETKVPT